MKTRTVLPSLSLSGVKRVIAVVLVLTACSFSAGAQGISYTEHQVSSGSLHHVETSIAINPTNSSNLIAAVILTNQTPGGCGYYYTTNRGQSWSGNESFFPYAGDPVVAIDGDGIGYYLYQIRGEKKLYLHKSTDGGQTWGSYRRTVVYAPDIEEDGNVDKPWMAISPVRNASNRFDICIAWTLTMPGSGNDLLFRSISTDSGSTFTHSPLAGGDGYSRSGAAVSYGSDGTPYIAWVRRSPTEPNGAIAMGFNFAEEFAIQQIGEDIRTDHGQYFVLKNSQVRVNSFPTLDVDKTEGPRRGWQYVAWADANNAEPDILFRRSTDGGDTWSSTLRVNTDTFDNGKDQWFPALSVDPDGAVNIVFYDSRNSSDNQQAQLCLARSTDGGASFSNTMISSSFNVSSAGSNFMGDYIQMVGDYAKSYPCWMKYVDSRYQLIVTEVAMPTVSVTLTNDISGGNAGGTLFVAKTHINSGNSTAVADQTTQIVGTDDERFSNYQGSGTTYKHKMWNSAASDYLLKEQFTITSQSSNHRANFIGIQSATITTSTVENVGAVGNVGFRDPWYLASGTSSQPDEFVSAPAPFSPTGAYNQQSGGVFLDQGGVPPNLTPPYYSVRAPLTQTVGGITWQFHSWDTSGVSMTLPGTLTGGYYEAPVVFRNWGTRTVTARYKGHLATGNTAGTGPQGQRKIVQAGSGDFYMTYESGNRIWFSRSSDGVNWSQDLEIGSYDPGEPESYPSITVCGDVANIVWQRVHWASPWYEEASIRLRVYDGYYNAWGSTQTVMTEQTSGPTAILQPVIDAMSLSASGTYDNKAIAWKSGSGLKVKFCSNGSWGSAYAVSGTDSYSAEPSIASYNGSNYFISWHDSNYESVKFIEAASGGSFQNAYTVSSSWTGNGAPSLAIADGNKAVVAWASHDNVAEGASVHVRVRSPLGVWGTVTSYSMDASGTLKPTIGTFESSADMSLIWSFEGSIYAALYEGSSWSGASLLASGSNGGGYPSINARTQGSFCAIWRKPSGAISVTTSGITPGQRASLTEYAYGSSEEGSVATTEGIGFPGTRIPDRINRHLFLSGKEGTYVGFEIAGVALAEGSASAVVPLVAVGTDENDLIQKLRTISFTPSGAHPRLTFSGAIYGRPFSDRKKNEVQLGSLGYRVSVQPQNGAPTLLWNVIPSSLIENDGSGFGEFRRVEIALEEFLGKSVVLGVEPYGIPEDWETLLVDDHLLLSSQLQTSSEALQESLQRSEDLLPGRFSLHQNYPNPFNPSTVITFDLPEPQHVSIVLFDVLGKQMKTIVDAPFGAGRHASEVDLRDLPSGSYFYRISAGQYSASRQLTVIK